ncbi:hypothetical protein HHK36_003596 [Tetracentron sinense]|uniref:Protein kinase domain-containing protein n=1 Tax=Tetracentron sinense TaxID=13715 RepID=A0A834ZRF0_TETSI|nr:hypothetical protein HHK36_003596 [Tetracentron sinense]
MRTVRRRNLRLWKRIASIEGLPHKTRGGSSPPSPPPAKESTVEAHNDDQPMADPSPSVGLSPVPEPHRLAPFNRPITASLSPAVEKPSDKAPSISLSLTNGSNPPRDLLSLEGAWLFSKSGMDQPDPFGIDCIINRIEDLEGNSDHHRANLALRGCVVGASLRSSPDCQETLRAHQFDYRSTTISAGSSGMVSLEGSKLAKEATTASEEPSGSSCVAAPKQLVSVLNSVTEVKDVAPPVAESLFVEAPQYPRSSDGASTSANRRIRRRSISITPEIGDDIVRAVRAMNETLKQNRLLREQGDDGSICFPSNERNNSYPRKDVCLSYLAHPDYTFVSNFRLDDNDEMSGERSATYNLLGKHINSHKAISLPSSPHEFRGQASERSGPTDFVGNAETVSTWHKVLESSMFLQKPLFPFQEWNIDFSELTVGTRVGIGFFGEVFRGVWNGTDVAIKIFLEQDLTAENMEDFCNEISILSRLRHPNGTRIHLLLLNYTFSYLIYSFVNTDAYVILFLGACTKAPRLSMVTEYMEMGSLYYLIHMSGQKKKLSWRRRLKMLRDICRGLMCIHRMKIVHRDLKSANCLVNKHWTVKICDFGLSRVMTDTPMRDSTSAGTPEWMAPELIRNEQFTEKCDVFSFGVIMWELCTLNRPWEGVPAVQVVYAVANEGSRLEIPEGPLGKLIADCWAEPDDRPSCEEILSRLLDCEYTLC